MSEQTYNVNGLQFTIAQLAGYFMIAEAFNQEVKVLSTIRGVHGESLVEEVIRYAKEHHGYFSEDDIEYLTPVG